MTRKQLQTAFVLAAFFVAGLSTWAGAASRFTQLAADDPVVARVDGTEVRRSDLIIAQQLLPSQFRKMPLDAIFPVLLKQVIDNILIMRAARAEGLDRTDTIRRRLEAIERRLLEGVYLERATEGRLTDQALRERYRMATETLRGKEEVRVRHILLDRKSEAASVIAELAGGADFATLARRKSKGSSKSEGGDLGYLRREAMLEPFADAAFGLTVGQFTPEPVKTAFGWHVIKVEDRRAVSIPSFEEMRPRLVRQIRAKVAHEIVTELRRNAKIEEFDIDGKSKPGSASRSPSTGTR